MNWNSTISLNVSNLWSWIIMKAILYNNGFSYIIAFKSWSQYAALKFLFILRQWFSIRVSQHSWILDAMKSSAWWNDITYKSQCIKLMILILHYYENHFIYSRLRCCALKRFNLFVITIFMLPILVWPRSQLTAAKVSFYSEAVVLNQGVTELMALGHLVNSGNAASI